MFRLSVMALGLTTTGFIVLAAEKPPAAYQNAMRAMGGAQVSLRNNVSSKNYEGIARDAGTMKTSFQAAEQFWTERRVQDAIAFSKSGFRGASDLEAAASARNDEAIASSQKTVMATCMGCHAGHRVRLEDGTYEIK